MAEALDESIGRPIRIEERTAGPSSWFWSGWSGWGWGRGTGMSQVNVEADRGGGEDISETIALGTISIRAAVQATFELAR